MFEYSLDDKEYNQIRLFDFNFQAEDEFSKIPEIGVYGASPLGDGFQAKFENFIFSKNEWFLNLDEIPLEYK